MMYADYRTDKQLSDGLENEVAHESAFGIGAYARTGVEFRVHEYGMLGLGYAWADPKTGSGDSDYLWRLGVGVDFYIIQMLAIFGELAYTAPQGDIDDLSYATANLGVLLKF